MIIRPGIVVKMLPTDRSHEKKPYYALVTHYDSNAIFNDQLRCITTIPGKHAVEMRIGSNWEYHKDRMEIIGDAAEFGHLLYNQIFHYSV